MKNMLIVFLLFLSVNGICQQQSTFPSVDQKDFPDAQIVKSKTYTGESLFGYMDGGAELYLEYGFSGAQVSEITLNGASVTVEIYRMNGPEEAFGIFSVSRFRCQSTPPFSPFTCQTAYQLQVCKGPYYINIIKGTTSKNDSLAALEIAETLVKKIVGPSADLGSYFPDIPVQTINNQAILVRGTQAVLNSLPDLAELFGDISGYYGVALNSEAGNDVSIRFNSKEAAENFISLHNLSTSEITRLSDKQIRITIKK